MNDNRYYNYMRSYVLGSLDGQKKAGLISENCTEKEHLLNEGIAVFLELAGHGYTEDHPGEVFADEETDVKEWRTQTQRYIEDTIGRKLTEREIGACYGIK